MIYINGRFMTQKLTGVNRFAFELCKALKVKNVDFIILAPRNILDEYVLSSFNIINKGFFKGHIWEQIELPYFLRKKKGSVLISFTGLGPIFYSNHIGTVHDLSFLENPRWFSFFYRTFYKFLTPIMVRNALKVITVSNFSKNEIQKYYSVKDEKISIIHNAVADVFFSKMPDDNSYEIKYRDYRKKYFLAVSSLDPKKNFLRLLEAFNSLESLDVYLFIIGKTDNVFNMPNISSSFNKKIRHLGYVTDQELKYVYSNAFAFIYPSIYEGFGIPPLEAMTCECPVIASDIEVIREIYEDAVFYIDPYSVDSIKCGIQKLYSDSELQNNLVKKGNEFVGKYSWNKSVDVLIELIEDYR